MDKAEAKDVDDSMPNPGHPDNRPEAVAARIAQARRSAAEAKAANAPPPRELEEAFSKEEDDRQLEVKEMDTRSDIEPGAGGRTDMAGGGAARPVSDRGAYPDRFGGRDVGMFNVGGSAVQRRPGGVFFLPPQPPPPN
jgi:hypothetical protein